MTSMPVVCPAACLWHAFRIKQPVEGICHMTMVVLLLRVMVSIDQRAPPLVVDNDSKWLLNRGSFFLLYFWCFGVERELFLACGTCSAPAAHEGAHQYSILWSPQYSKVYVAI